MLMEMDQTDGSYRWQMTFGNIGADTALTDMSFTGSLGTSEYQRLYATGYDYTSLTAATKDHYIVYVDTTYDDEDGTKPTALANSISWSTGSNGYISTQTVSHIYVQYLNVFACGEHDDARAATSQGKPWVLWGVVVKTTDAFSVYKRWNFGGDTGVQGWCSGLYSDGKHAFILITSTEASTPTSGTTGSDYGFSIVMKDIIYNQDHYLRHFNLEEATVSNLFIESFTVKTENSVKTHFVAGNTGSLFASQGGAYSTATNMQSFIAKFVVDVAETDADNNPSADTEFFCYTNTVFNADVDTTDTLQFEDDPSASDGWAVFTPANFLLTNGFDFDKGTQSFTYTSYLTASHQTSCFPDTTIGEYKPIKMQDINYYIGQGMKYFDTPEFVYLNDDDEECTDFVFNYTLKYDYQNGTISTILPSFIQYDGYNLIIAVNTTDISRIGIHDFKHSARPPVGPGYEQDFRVTIHENTPPSFLAELEDQHVTWNTTEVYTLPLYKDMENDVYISAALDGLSYLPLFINFKPSKRRFTFTPEAKHEGTYTIKVTLTESTGYTSVFNTFKLYVISPDFELINANYMWMNATLDVNRKGDLWINFDQNLHKFEEIELNRTNTDIFLSGMGEDNYNLTWKVVEITERQIYIKLKFDNPSAIGLFDKPDYLNVTFINNETIRGEGAEYILRAQQNQWIPIYRQTEYKSS